MDDERPLAPRHVGWHADPFGRHAQRWWDGEDWTERVQSSRGQGIDPPGIVHAPVGVIDSSPAPPISDALQPIQRPRIMDKIAVLIGFVVFLGLIALLVVALTS